MMRNNINSKYEGFSPSLQQGNNEDTSFLGSIMQNIFKKNEKPQNSKNFADRELIHSKGNIAYRKIKIIGEGSYGSVYLAQMINMKNQTLSKNVAIKKFKIDNEEEGLPATSLREICLLKSLNHPNIIKLNDIIFEDQKKSLSLVMDYMDMDLSKFIENQKEPPSPYTIKSIMYQILRGLRYMHLRRCIHRDIKPGNILMDNETLTVKIADFGLAKPFYLPSRNLSIHIQTLWYRAPEVILGDSKYTTAVDIWAVGCILAELVTLQPLFSRKCEIGQLFLIFSVLGVPNNQNWNGVEDLPNYKKSFPKFKPKGLSQHSQELQKVDEHLFDLLRKMLALNPIDRISSLDALKHRYFEGIEDQLGY